MVVEAMRFSEGRVEERQAHFLSHGGNKGICFLPRVLVDGEKTHETANTL